MNNKLDDLFSHVRSSEQLLNRIENLEKETMEVYINEYDTISLNRLASIIIEELSKGYTPSKIYLNLKRYL